MNKQRFTSKIIFALIIMGLSWAFVPHVSFQIRAAGSGGVQLNIISMKTDKPIYQKNDQVVFTVRIKNAGETPVPGAWVDVWIDKMPISVLNKNPFYHDAIYNQLIKSFGCLTAYMPDPNPSYNPVLNEFVAGPITPGETRDIKLSYHATGEYTRIQNYTVKVYDWNPALGKNLDGIIYNQKATYGEMDLKKGRYAQEGVKAITVYPNGKRAVLVVRIDDVKPIHAEEVKQLVAILNKHKAKGTFLLLEGSAAKCRDELSEALASGDEIGLHGTDHECKLPRSEHIPECLTNGQGSPPYWHEFEGPHFQSNSYDFQYKRLKSTYDEIVTNLKIKPVTFCAPQVAFSEITLRAAKELGIEFSSDLVGERAEYAYDDLIEIPYLGDYTWGVSAINYKPVLNAAKEDLDRISSEGGVMVMVLHTIQMNSLRYKWIDEMLSYADTKDLWYATIKDVGTWFKNAEKKPVSVKEIPGGADYLIENP